MPSLQSYKAAFMLLFWEDDKGTPLDAPVHSEIEEQLEERLERVIQEQAPWTQQLEELFGRLIEKSVKNLGKPLGKAILTARLSQGSQTPDLGVFVPTCR